MRADAPAHDHAGNEDSATEAPDTAGAFRRLRIEPAYKAVSAEIERSILTGLLPPGTPLPAEQALAERFGVNRSTIREAIRRIEQEGLLQRRAGRRLFVTLPGLHEPMARATREGMLARTGFMELWQVAVELEPLAARLAAAHATDAEIDEIEAHLAEADRLLRADGERPADAVARDAELDSLFHALVARAAGNRALMLAREPFSLLYGPAYGRLQRALPQAARRNADAHARILAALRDHDADEAEAWTRRHLVDFRRGFEMAGLDPDAPVATG